MKRLQMAMAGLCFCLSAGHALEFDADLGGAWQFVEEDGVCVMHRPLGQYGLARFTGEPGRGLRLQVVPNRDLFSGGGIIAVSAAPEWHAAYPHTVERGALRHVRGGVVSAGDPLATSLMMDLYAGLAVRISQNAWFADRSVALALSPVRFRAAYDRFAACYQWLMPANYEDVERTRVGFDSGSAELTEAHKAALQTVARYVLADRDVVRVFVDGHTDTTGRERDNMRLSERRARVVADWLVACGLDRNDVVVRFHAARYPVEAGSSAATHAQNRRATVRLERHARETLAGR